MFALIALQLVSHPEQRAEDRGAIVAGQVHDTGFDDEAAQFDEVPRALAALASAWPRSCARSSRKSCAPCSTAFALLEMCPARMAD
jgi:hypothetical protein